MTNTPVSTGTSADGHRSPARPPLTHPRPARTRLSTAGKVSLAVIGLVFLACGSPKPSQTSDSGGISGGVVTTADTSPGASKDNPAPVGTEVTPAKDWTITVLAPATDATADITKANQFNKPQIPGHKLYSVLLRVHNGSDKPGMALAQMKLGALPPNGVRVDQTFAVAGYPTLDASAQLQPGATLEGRMVFELDPATFPETVLLAEPQFTVDTNADQRFLALK